MRYAGDRRVGLLPRNRPATRRPLRIAGSSPQFGLISVWHLRLASLAFRLIALPLLRATLRIGVVRPGDRTAAMTLGRQTGLTGASTLYGCFVSAMRHSWQGRPGNGPRGSSNTDRFPPCVEQRRRSSPHRIKRNVKRWRALGRTDALSGAFLSRHFSRADDHHRHDAYRCRAPIISSVRHRVRHTLMAS